MTALKRIDEALFGFGSPVTLGLIRILTASLALVNFLLIALDFDAWFTERGFYPAWFAERWAEGIPRLNLLSGVTDPGLTATLYVLLLVACLLTTLGLWTRVASVAMFVLMVSFHHRTPDVLHSGDTLLRAMAFIVMVAPSGAALSLDRVIGLWRGTAPAEPAPVSLWPQRLAQFQVAIVYFTTVWHKWYGPAWRDGTATWYVPQLHEFDRFPVPAFVDQTPFVQITTYGTLLVELALATLVFARPLRKWVLLAGVLLHAGIEYRFNIPLFGWIMVSTYVAFYSGEEVAAWWRRLAARAPGRKVVALSSKGLAWQPGPLRALQALDAFDKVEYRRGETPGMSAQTEDGAPADLARATLARSPGAWALWLVPPLWARLLRDACGQPNEKPLVADPDRAPARVP